MPKFLGIEVSTKKQRRKRERREAELNEAHRQLQVIAQPRREIVPSVINNYVYNNHAEPRGEPQNTHRNYALVNYNNGGSEDEGYLRIASEAVKSFERIACAVAPDFLHTVRHLITAATIVAVAVIAGYCLLGIAPHLLVLLSRLLVDLPLGILSALCSLLPFVLLQLPLAIVHGVIAIVQGILWVVDSLLNFIFLCVTLPFSFLYTIVANLLGLVGRILF